MKTYSDPFPRTSSAPPGAPVVLVVGPNGGNRGDQLMMQAIADQWEGRVHFPPPMILRVPLPHIRSPQNALCVWKDVTGRIFHRLRQGAPTLILDCSGYQYADAWASLLPLFRMRLRLYRRLTRRGARLVLLPQSFGPFTDPALRDCCRELLSLADRIHVRDRPSAEYLVTDLGLPENLVVEAPDFTSAVSGIRHEDPEVWRNRFVLIPNRNMVEKTAGLTLESYILLFLYAADRVRKAGLEPVLLVHDDGDLDLAIAMAYRMDPPMTVLDLDAQQAKGCMGLSRGVMASRYHALISALSQGVPAVGTSWSHKYEALFDDYGVEEFLLRDLNDRAGLDRCLAELNSVESRSRLTERLSWAAGVQREKTVTMWREIESFLSIPSRAP